MSQNDSVLWNKGERVVPSEVPELVFIEHLARYKFADNNIGQGVLLDAACGTGYGTMVLSKRARICYGIDVSLDAIRYAKSKFSGNGIAPIYLVADVKYLPFKKGVFDIICSFETIEHITEPDLFLGEIKRILKQGCYLLISTPNKYICSPNSKKTQSPYHVIEYYTEEFEELLKKYFNNINYWGQKRNIRAQRNESKKKRYNHFVNIINIIDPLRSRDKLVNIKKKIIDMLKVDHKLTTDDFVFIPGIVKGAEYIIAKCKNE